MSYYNTDYTETQGFEPKLKRNDQKIKDVYIPSMLAAGLNFSPHCIDNVPFELSEDNAGEWIDPLSRNARNGIRPSDLRSDGNKRFKIAGSDSKSLLIEVKDYAQENYHLVQGIRYRNLRTYLALQHLWEVPLCVMFLDNAQESGNDALPAFNSAFKENGSWVPYGGLLLDLKVDPIHSFRPKDMENDKRNGQVRFTAQEDRQGKFPRMKTIQQITDDMKSGRVSRVQGDPRDLSLWIMLKTAADRFKDEPLIVPPGGLVYFETAS